MSREQISTASGGVRRSLGIRLLLTSVSLGVTLLGTSLSQIFAADTPVFQHGARITSIAWSPDGKTIATSGYDATVQVWDAKTGKRLHKLVGHNNAVARVRYSSDGKLLGSVAWFWSAASSRNVLADNQFLIVWNANVGKEVRRIPLGRGGALDFTFCVDQVHVALTGTISRINANIRTFNARSGGRVADFKYRKKQKQPNHDWRIESTGQKWRVVTVSHYGAFPRRNRRIEYRAIVRLTDLLTGKEVVSRVLRFENNRGGYPSNRNPAAPAGAIVASDSKRKLAAVALHSGRVVLLRLPELQVAHTIETRSGPNPTPAKQVSLTFLPDGRLFFIDESRAFEINANGQSKPVKFEKPQLGISCVTPSPDGRYLATGHVDGSIRRWKIEDGKLIL